ncbi:MAG: tetratricopeptide repeat protein, partial [Geitlerinemataceae cyanobacterium]
EAIASWDKAVEFKPDLHQAWVNRGAILCDYLGRYEESIASLDKAVEFKPDFHEAWNNRGVALGNLGRTEEAIASYDKAVEFKPDDHQAWYNRGIALGNLGRYEEAIASYDKAVEFKPDDHQAWNNRGIALRNLGRYEEAIASHKRALKIRQQIGDPKGEANSLLALGSLYQQCGKVREGIALTSQATQILQELDVPIESMPYPNWLKSAIQVYQRGGWQRISIILGGIILLPFGLIFVLVRFPWLILRSKLRPPQS